MMVMVRFFCSSSFSVSPISLTYFLKLCACLISNGQVEYLRCFAHPNISWPKVNLIRSDSIALLKLLVEAVLVPYYLSDVIAKELVIARVDIMVFAQDGLQLGIQRVERFTETGIDSETAPKSSKLSKLKEKS